MTDDVRDAKGESRHVVITGGSSGIGLATAEAFGRRGATVSLIARDPDRLADAKTCLVRSGIAADIRSADVRDRIALEAAIGELVASHGPCDILVTSAGIAHPGYIQDLDPQVFREEMDVNYFGTLHAIKAVIPSMIERRRGSIVGVSSAAGILGIFGYTAYSPTKFAVRGLLESLRAEMRPHDVAVHCVFPADIDTPMLERENVIKPPETAAISGTIKPLPPADVAEAIVAAIGKTKFAVYTDTTTRLLGPVSGFAPSWLSRKLDARARKTNPDG
ncbi:MAG: SDR family oxidoreductase [Actinomycetota bacterium]|nr:SDR family oxidoreductase [Actinomycetota bacterium]